MLDLIITNDKEDFSEIASVLQIKEQILGDVKVNSVDGRALHVALGFSSDFSDWIKGKINTCDLVQSIDYAICTVPAKQDGKFCPIDYILTLNAAKMVAMSCRGEVAKRVRQYFLSMEKVAQQTIRKEIEETKSIEHTFNHRLKNYCITFDILGWSNGWKEKEAIELGYEFERNTGINPLPKMIRENALTGVGDLTLDKTKGIHAALVPIGSKSLNVTGISRLFNEVSSTEINKILIRLGYQTRINKSKYAPTEKAKKVANTNTLQSGKHIGKVYIESWHYLDNSAFKTEIDKEINDLIKSRVVE